MTDPLFGVNQSLKVKFFSDGPAAAKGGFNYNDTTMWDPRPKALTIEQAVVVQNGTIGGNATIDLVLVDEDGGKYVTMVTAALLKMLV